MSNRDQEKKRSGLRHSLDESKMIYAPRGSKEAGVNILLKYDKLFPEDFALNQ